VSWDIIRKQAADEGLSPNLRDYNAARETFTWKAVRAELAMPGPRRPLYDQSWRSQILPSPSPRWQHRHELAQAHSRHREASCA